MTHYDFTSERMFCIIPQTPLRAYRYSLSISHTYTCVSHQNSDWRRPLFTGRGEIWVMTGRPEAQGLITVYLLHQLLLLCIALRSSELTSFYLTMSLLVFKSQWIPPNMQILEFQSQFQKSHHTNLRSITT